MKTGFLGSIETDDLEQVLNGLRTWVGNDGLDVRMRLSGEEITYEDTRLELLCHRTMLAGDTEAEEASGGGFIIEGSIYDTEEEAEAVLEKLRATFEAMSVPIEVDVTEEDDEEEDEE